MSSKALPAPATHLFRHLFEQASLGIAVEDLEGKLLLANPALCSMLGYTEKELCSMSCSEFANPEDSQDDWALFQQIRAGVIDHYSLEKRYLRKDGAQLWGRLNVSLSRDDDGGTPLVFAFVEEITESKLAEQELARSNDRFRLAVEAGKSVGWEWDLKSGQDSWFGDLQTMFGIPSDRFVGRPEDFYRYVHPDDRQIVSKAVADAREGRKPYEAEFRVVRLDGTVRWVTASGEFYYGANGDPERMLGMAADITDRKRAEKALEKSEEKFSKAFRQSPMALSLTSAKDHRYIDVNETFEHITGWRRDEVIGRTPFDIGLWVDPAERVELTKRLLTEGSLRNVEGRFRMRDGSVRTGLASAELIELDGQPCIIAVTADVTEHKHAEEALKRSESNYRLFVAQSSEGIFCQELDRPIPVDLPEDEQVQRILHESYMSECNDALARMYGISPANFIDKRLTETLDPENPVNIELTRDYIRGGYRVVDRESHEVDPLGNPKVFQNSMIGIVENGKLLRTWGIQRDITDRRRSEQARADAELALRESEQRFRLATQAGKMYAYQWDVATDTVVRSDESVNVIGLVDQGEQVTRQQLLARVHPDDRALFARSVEQLSPENPTIQISYRILRPDGSLVWLEKNARAFFDEQGRMLSVTGIVADITERKRAEEALQESEARERARVKELETILDAVPVPVRIAHDAACRRMTGNRAAYELARVPVGRNVSSSAPPAEGPRYRLMEEGVEVAPDTLPMQYAAATGKPVYRRALTVLYEDGTKRETVENAVPLLDEAGKPRGAVGTSIDLTEQKEAEDKFRLLLDSTAEAIYGIDLEHRCTFCNPACLRALGFERAEEVVGKNMHDLIHHHRADGTLFPPEECRVHRVLQNGEGSHAEDEVLWRPDGTSFPAEYWSYPQRRGEQVVGAVVAFVDITQRKLAEVALANVSRRLIEAQEQERTRIARELHDDIGQRVAMLAIEMEQLPRTSSDLPIELTGRMRELWKQTSEIATDIQSLSHELHSSKLQYLGVAAAIRSFCKEFGEQQKVEIDFASHDLPNPLSPDISLCLFRVLQEALHNSAKHSGVRHFEVRLWGTADELHLTVHDSGTGFDREATRTGYGLGLISMEERLKLVNGTLSIESKSKSGTTIRARVPLSSNRDSLRATG